MNRSWQAPIPPGFDGAASDNYKLGWVDEICSDGEIWNESQPGYRDWRKALEILNGDENPRDNEFRTYASGRRLRTNSRTAIAGLSNIRPIWGFQSASPTYEQYAGMYNKTSRALFLEGYWGQDIKDAVCYAMATGAGYVRPTFRRNMHGMGKGKIQLFTYGQPCVLPFQMPLTGNLQEAYAVTLMDEYPIAEAHSRWPLFQDLLQPTKSQLWYSSEIRGAAEKNSQKRPWNWMFQSREAKKGGTDLYVPIRFTTIIDPRVNETGRVVPMGQPGSPWYYEVPPYDATLQNLDAARLYPFRRLIISSENCILYDGPAFNWHGQLDLIPFTVDKWPWAPSGFSMVHDGYNIQKNIDAIERGALDRLKAQNNLSLAYDINAVTPQEAQAFDPLDAKHNRVGYDGQETQQPYTMPLPMEWYRITSEMMAMLERLDNELDYTFQIRDLVELSKARVIGQNAADIEKWLSSLGPIVKEISHSMEKPLAMVGDQVGWLIPQYMTSRQVMSYVGAEAMSLETFDYDPLKIYPSHLPDENPHGPDETMVPSKYTPAQRARWMRENIPFIINPGSVHEISQMSLLLVMLQMKQRGMAISDWTCMRSANIPDLGSPPEGNTEFQRYWNERKDNVTREASLAAMTAVIGAEQNLTPPGGATAPPNPATVPPPNGSTHRGGRPPTAQVAPHLEVKSGGRTTIAESK